MIDLLLRPFSFYVKCFTLPNLFAGKMHALLFRKWKENVKGRDWYDFEWYVKKWIGMNLKHFIERVKKGGDRTTPAGDLILLEDQDRSLWDRDMIKQELSLVERAFSFKRPGLYTLQAAIAALYAEVFAPDFTPAGAPN